MIKFNGKELETFVFPAGELQVKLPIAMMYDWHYIEIIYENSNDIVALIQLLDFVKERHISIQSISIKYMPFSRMDRHMEGYAFSLRAFANLINQFEARFVYTWDMHSAACKTLINNLVDNSCLESKHEKFIEDCTIDYHLEPNLRCLLYPDSGAVKRYPHLARFFDTRIYTTKERGQDGHIDAIKTYVLSPDCDIFIFDDICDGGATFVEIAKIIKPQITGKMFLFTTHGIYSKGLDELFQYYEVVACTNSRGDDKFQFANEFLPQFKVYP